MILQKILLNSVEDDRIIARNTTLGADDGIGVAFGLALLADDSIKHPAIEFVSTSDEERGMLGIENFDFSQLKGEYVINVDSDDEGMVVVGCAGGPVVKVDLPIRKVPADHEKEFVKIRIRRFAAVTPERIFTEDVPMPTSF